MNVRKLLAVLPDFLTFFGLVALFVGVFYVVYNNPILESKPDPEERLIEVLENGIAELQVSVLMIHRACVRHHGELACFKDEEHAAQMIELELLHGQEVNKRIGEICADGSCPEPK